MASIFLIMVAYLMAMEGFTFAVDPVGVDMPKENSLDPGLMEIKSILSSVQGSLITSVSLIQDQMDHFGKQYVASLDQRLARIESRLSQIDIDVKDVKEKGKAWDTFRDHASSWAELMTSVDSKVDHLSMSQTEQLVSISGQLSSLQTALGEGMEKISQRVTYLESQVRSGREETQADVITVMRNIEAKLTDIAFNGNTNSRTIRPRTGSNTSSKPAAAPPCVELKDLMKRSASKVDSILAILAEEHTGKEVTSGSEVDYSPDNFEDHEDEEERLGKMLLPIQRGLRRLKEIKHLNQKVDSAVTKITQIVKVASEDIDTKFNGFMNTTTEMLEQQQINLKIYGQKIEGVQQCCSTTLSDLNGLKIDLKKMDTQIDEDNQKHVQFDTEKIISALQDQEKLIQETLALCSGINQASKTSDPVLNESNQNEIGHQESSLSFKTCDELATAGLVGTKVYTLEVNGASINENALEFRRRLCEQEVSGSVRISNLGPIWTFFIVIFLHQVPFLLMNNYF